MTIRDELLKASCAAAIAVEGNTAPEWVQLFPMGAVKPVDGREPWDATDAQAIVSASKMPASIDYDHGTDRVQQGERNSRAAGWMQELKIGGPNGEPGIWAKVDWTPAGGKAVADREYRYISPVFMHRKKDRAITKVLRASLTNDPALELKALASQQQETTLDLKELAVKLGLPETATLAEVMAKIDALQTAQTALASKTKLLGNVAVAAGLSSDKEVGDTEVTAICAKLKVPATADATKMGEMQQKIDELNIELANVKKGNADDKAKTEVEKAIADGKLPPAQKDWAIGYCSRDPEGFAKFIGAQPKLLPNGSLAPQGAKEGDLSDEQKQVCEQLGLDPEVYKKELASQKKEAA